MKFRQSLLVKLVLSITLGAMYLLSAVLAGCGGKPQPTPTPTKTPTAISVAAVAPVAQGAGQAQEQAAPTATQTSTPTTVPSPTATVTQTPTPTTTAIVLENDPAFPPTETPALSEEQTIEQWRAKTGSTNTPASGTGTTTLPTATPAPAYTGATEINPLTGLPVAAYKLNRRPLAIKVPNYPWEARPQSGLSMADVVVEHEAEAYLTRFTTIFYGSDANPALGPVRSVRLVDGELVSIFRASLVTSGGHPVVKQRVTSQSWASGFRRVISPDEPFTDGGCTYRVTNGKRYELTLYTSTACLWNLSAQRGANQRPDFQGMWRFDESPPSGGRDATHLRITYKPTWSIAEYRYDAGSRTYKRFDVGKPTFDAHTGRQIAPPNVVVLYVNHVNSDIAADKHDPNNIWYSLIHQIWGEGTGKLMRDGKVYNIRWVRENAQQPNDRLIFLDGAGQKISLRPGPTWIQLVRPGADHVID
jgi:hypothetical protein